MIQYVVGRSGQCCTSVVSVLRLLPLTRESPLEVLMPTNQLALVSGSQRITSNGIQWFSCVGASSASKRSDCKGGAVSNVLRA